MFKEAFQKVDFQSRVLSAYSLRHSVIAQNIANVETPNYKRKDINFESILTQRLSDSGLGLRLTNAAHMNHPLPFDAHVIRDSFHSMRLDKNSVNIESEMAEQAKNAIQYNTVISRVDSEFRKLQQAIKGGR